MKELRNLSAFSEVNIKNVATHLWVSSDNTFCPNLYVHLIKFTCAGLKRASHCLAKNLVVKMAVKALCDSKRYDIR